MGGLNEKSKRELQFGAFEKKGGQYAKGFQFSVFGFQLVFTEN
jgi:hypothetical protein